MNRAVGVAVAIALAVSAPAAQSRALSPQDTQAIDAVFTDYDKPASPGCMLGVVADGAFLYTRGYGRANLEHDVAFTPQTVFDIGSTSKQFLATAILLLEQDGKLSLDDDIRKYLPEVPDYGQPITIRHLLTHTSGLRDYITLLTLAGWQMEDVTSPAQALDLVSRQKGLDFQPGAEFAYSNTGFFLPSLIVERVSGKGLAAFAAERIFRPAGMHATRYMDDHAAVVPGRATGYEPSGTGFRVALSNWEQLGDGAVQTSIADLLKWDANFYAPTVGGARLVQALQTPGRLASGSAPRLRTWPVCRVVPGPADGPPWRVVGRLPRRTPAIPGREDVGDGAVQSRHGRPRGARQSRLRYRAAGPVDRAGADANAWRARSGHTQAGRVCPDVLA